MPKNNISKTSSTFIAHSQRGNTLIHDVLEYHHEDHLTDSASSLRADFNVDTDDMGNVLVVLDYYPYGDVRLDEQSSSYENDYKFTGKEKDEDTGLYYYEARYYDSGIGRFTAIDPMAKLSPETFLKDPQQLNSYTYVRNNPLGAIDPDGLLTIFIHGTVLPGKNTNPFSEGYMKQVATDLGDNSYTNFSWSGTSSEKARTEAARNLESLVRNYEFSEGEQLNIVGHSHGGNVSIEAINTNRMLRNVDNLVLLGAPNRDDYTLDNDNVGAVYNVYSLEDNIQNNWGGEFTTNPAESTYANHPWRAGENVKNLRFRDMNKGPIETHSWLRTQEAWSYIRKFIEDKDEESSDDKDAS